MIYFQTRIFELIDTKKDRVYYETEQQEARHLVWNTNNIATPVTSAKAVYGVRQNLKYVILIFSVQH